MRETAVKPLRFFGALGVVAIPLVVTACATKPPVKPLNAEEAAYLSAVERDGTSVIVSDADRAAAWGRAQVFIVEHAGMKLQLVTDYVLETYNPRGGALFWYRVTRTSLGDGNSRIDVTCVFGDPLAGMEERAIQNAKVLAHFIKSGEINPRFVSHRYWGEPK